MGREWLPGEAKVRPVTSSIPPSRCRILGILVVLVVAAALRLPGLGHASLWMDEGVTWDLARTGPLGVLERQARLQEPNPPLYYELASVTWSWGRSEAALRLPAALAGIATAVLFASWTRLGVFPAFLAGLLVALSARQVADSLEARAYSLLALFLAALVRALEGWLEEGGRRRLGAVLLAEVAAFYSHLMAVPFLLALNLWVLIRRRRVLGPEDPPCWRGWLAGQALVALACLPWLLRLGSSPSYPYRPGLGALVQCVYQANFSFTLALPLWSVWVLAGAACLSAAWGVAGRGRASELWWVYLFGTLPVAALLTALTPHGGVFLPRYFSFLAPAFAAATALAGVRLARWGRVGRAGAVLLVLGWALLNLASLGNSRLNPDFQGQDWRGLAARLRERADPGERVLVQPGMALPVLSFYLGPTDLQVVPVDAPSPDFVESLVAEGRSFWLAFLPGHPLARQSLLDRDLVRRRAVAELWQNQVASAFDLVVLLRFAGAGSSRTPGRALAPAPYRPDPGSSSARFSGGPAPGVQDAHPAARRRPDAGLDRSAALVGGPDRPPGRRTLASACPGRGGAGLPGRGHRLEPAAR